MAINEFPIGQTLLGVSTIEDQEFGGDELCLDEVKFYFENPEHKITVVTLSPDVDTDEITVKIEKVNKRKTKKNPHFYASPSLGNNELLYSLMLGAKLMAVWVSENNQGYQDQVIFAFESLHPSITFVSEGSVIKAYLHKQILKKQIPRVKNKSEIFVEASLISELIKENPELINFFPDMLQEINGLEEEKIEPIMQNQQSNQSLNKPVDLLNRITINHHQSSIYPCIRGMRIRVTDILEMLGKNVSSAEILEDFPDLEPEDIQACLLFAAQLTNPNDTAIKT